MRLAASRGEQRVERDVERGGVYVLVEGVALRIGVAPATLRVKVRAGSGRLGLCTNNTAWWSRLVKSSQVV